MIREQIFINQGAVTVEVCNQPRKYLSNREIKRAIRNFSSIHTTIIISLMNVTIENQIRASDVDRRIISLKIVQNWTLWIRISLEHGKA